MDKTKKVLDLEPDLPWSDTIRRETGLIEHVCVHGVGHPARASVHWMSLHGMESMGIHGCCGCCRNAEWIVQDLTEGMRIANEYLKKSIEINKVLANKINAATDAAQREGRG